MTSLLMLLCMAALCGGIPEEDVERFWEEGFQVAAHSHLQNGTEERSYRKRNHPLVEEHALRVSAFNHAARRLADRYNVELEEAERHLLTRASLRKEVNQNALCLSPSPVSCSTSGTYRSYDGSCNNVERPQIGMPFTRNARILYPNYGDGVGSLRRSVTGGEMPSARFVSNTVQDDVNNFHTTVTHQVPVFGQFLDHDLTSTPEFSARSCCTNRGQAECMPIEVSSNDDFFGPLGIDCLSVQRSIPLCAGISNTREQVNQATAFIDASMVYGNSKGEMTALRNGTGIFLQTFGGANNLPPRDFNRPECGDQGREIYCFRAGDDRVNENPALTSMHTLFLREHNRVAQALRSLNPSWSNDLVWEETRRVVIAEIQQVTYGEFLPQVLGPYRMTDMDLYLPSPGIYSTYDHSVDVTTLSEFSTAAFRFGHTLLRSTRSLPTGSPSSYLLDNNFNTPVIYYQSPANIDRSLLGAIQDPSMAFDNFFIGSITNHLLKAPNAQYGGDLIARNLQRGRDHGLPSYNEYRVACGLSRIVSFSDLVQATGSNDRASRLNLAYSGVLDDIELFVGGVSEPPVSGGVVGPTFGCIIGEQFKRAKVGDRYFFTHGSQIGSFRSSQLSNLRKRTLGGIMCDTQTSGIIPGAPQNSFLLGQTNIPCANQVKLNLIGWYTAGS